jgi:chemotaxis receptor (MCP) glutamine deamidase CheD
MFGYFSMLTHGQIVVGKEWATAIISCIVIAVYNPGTKNAWMSHVMLPGQAPQKSGEKPRYAADNTGRLFNQQMESGSVIGNMEVYLVRTGNILRKEDDTI